MYCYPSLTWKRSLVRIQYRLPISFQFGLNSTRFFYLKGLVGLTLNRWKSSAFLVTVVKWFEIAIAAITASSLTAYDFFDINLPQILNARVSTQRILKLLIHWSNPLSIWFAFNGSWSLVVSIPDWISLAVTAKRNNAESLTL